VALTGSESKIILETAMQHRTLGKTGFSVSEIGLGCWQLGGDFGPVGDDTANAILGKARDLGVDFWDTADVYGGGQSESRIGAFKPGREVHIATKVGRNGELFPNKYSKAKVKESLVGSLKRLKVEAIDLAQLHCVPTEVLADGSIFGWMDDFVQEGLLRFHGASVETIEQGMMCLEHEGVSSLQIIFNLFRQDAAAELLPRAEKQKVGIIVRLPLASGLLSGKFGKSQQFTPQDHRNYNRDGAAFSVGETFSGLPFEKGVELVEELKGINADRLAMSHLALRWILDHPAVSTIIAGVSKPAQLDDNVAAAAREPLPSDFNAELADWYQAKVRPYVRGAI
jgi:aryl-alcohol dehydrogenase-like predicted oxidoreductase